MKIVQLLPLKEYSYTFTHYILVDSSTVISWRSPFVILGVSDLFCLFYSIFDGNPVSKHCRPDQTPHNVASDLSLHCLPMTLLQVSG